MSDATVAVATTTLSELEERIERGLDAWIEAALAWEQIRRERRYLESGYSDFDTYTRERWGKRRETIDQMIRSAQAIEQLNAIALTPLPANEAHARHGHAIPDARGPAGRDDAGGTAAVERGTGGGDRGDGTRDGARAKGGAANGSKEQRRDE